jgi:pimeloyl-ACP methyl ester carboxylesterase
VTTRRGRVAWVRTVLALTAALALAGTGCTTTGNDAARSIPSVEHVACPPEVSVVTVLALTCGYVTVPEDRSQPAGAKVRLFVFQIEPDGPATGAPVIFLGGEIGSSLDYGNVAAIATSMPGHELIAIELRGTGHSEPNLSCPEVDALAGRARSESVSDPGMRRTFLMAVGSCRARIVSRGIDLGAFDVPAMAADVLDVVKAMHLSTWEMLSKGSTSRVVFEAMRSDPAGLQGVVLYNPEFPDTDPLVQAFESTRDSLAQLAGACRADRLCRSHFPDVEGNTRVAIDRLQAHPVVVRVGGTSVLMDGAALLRSLRALLSSNPGDPGAIGRLPATIAAIAEGRHRVRVLTRLGGLDDSPQTYCTGYLPQCSTVQTLNQGAYYSVLCRDEAPFSDTEAMSELAHGDAAWTADYVDSPYLDVCEVWDVPAAEDTVTEPISSDVPVYIYSGALSPFVAPTEVRRGIAGLSRVSLGVSPVSSSDLALFDVTGAHCPNLRLGFIDDPLGPVDFGCLADGHLRFFAGPI